MRLRARQSRILYKTAAGSVVIVILVIAVACGRGTPPPASSPVLSPELSRRVEGPVQSTPPLAAPVASLPPEEKDGPFDGAQGRPAVYQSLGRRDPFRPPRWGTAQKASMLNLKLTGIIRGPHSYYALVESDLSPGMGYIIRENDVVDSAKVVKITKDSVVFEVQTRTAERKPLTRYVHKYMLPAESR